MDIAKTLVSLARATFRELRERNPSSTRANNSFHTPVIWYLGTDLPRRIASHRITAGSPFFKVTSHRPRSPGAARRSKRRCAINIGSYVTIIDFTFALPVRQKRLEM